MRRLVARIGHGLLQATNAIPRVLTYFYWPGATIVAYFIVTNDLVATLRTSPSPEFFKTSFAGIGLSATLATLSSRLFTIVEESNRPAFAKASKHLCFSALGMTLVLLLRYGQADAQAWSVKSSLPWVATFTRYYFGIVVMGVSLLNASAFLFGLGGMLQALRREKLDIWWH